MHGPRRKPLVKPSQTRQNPVVTIVQGDEGFLSAEETALNNAEADCDASGTCSLPATQHIQIRVILILLKYSIQKLAIYF